MDFTDLGPAMSQSANESRLEQLEQFVQMLSHTVNDLKRRLSELERLIHIVIPDKSDDT